MVGRGDHAEETALLATTLSFPTRILAIHLNRKLAILFNRRRPPCSTRRSFSNSCNNNRSCTSSYGRHARLLPTLETYAKELKTSHEAWKETLSQAKPGSDPSQIASEAMEMALKELEDRLPSASPQDESEALSLDEAMAFIRRHTSRG